MIDDDPCLLGESLEEKENLILNIFSSEVNVSDSVFNDITNIIASIEIDGEFFEENSSLSPCIQEVEKEKLNLKEVTKSEEVSDDLRQVLLKAKLPQKVKLALLGNATCRALLIRDSNKIIQQCVLKNPRLQTTEIEEFAKNSNLSEFVLRSIGVNSQWMRNYSLKYAITFNPKTPQDVSIKWVKFLNTVDLRKLAKSKNVPSVIAVTARKRIAESEKN